MSTELSKNDISVRVIKVLSENYFDRLKSDDDKTKLIEDHSVKFAEFLNLDSLDLVELIMALEEEFNTEIPDSAAENISTIADVVEFIFVHSQEKVE